MPPLQQDKKQNSYQKRNQHAIPARRRGEGATASARGAPGFIRCQGLEETKNGGTSQKGISAVVTLPNGGGNFCPHVELPAQEAYCPRTAETPSAERGGPIKKKGLISVGGKEAGPKREHSKRKSSLGTPPDRGEWGFPVARKGRRKCRKKLGTRREMGNPGIVVEKPVSDWELFTEEGRKAREGKKKEKGGYHGFGA